MTPKKQRNELPPEQIERALRGSRKDLDALVRWYGPVVWGAVAARVRGNPALVPQMEDLVANVWLELCRNDFKRLGYYDRSRGELGYFLRLQAGQIAWNLVMRQLARSEHLSEAAGEEPPNKRLEDQVVSRDLLERLAQRARARLGESDWALFNATFVEGLTSEEMATRSGTLLKTVYQQKYRLRAKLEALAQELLDETSPTRAASGGPKLLVVLGLVIAQLLQESHGEPREFSPPVSTSVDPHS